MTDPTYCAIAVVMDRSGSMSSIQSEAEGALRTFVTEQKEQPGRATLTLARFDDRYDITHDMEWLGEVDPASIKLEPRGMTALLDAIGRTITFLGKRLSDLPEETRPGKVLFCIVTDGHENASREWTRDKVFEAIKRQTDDYQWEFLFLAATQDAIGVAHSYGIHTNNADYFVADAVGTQSAGQSMSSYATAYRGGASGQSLRLENEDERVKGRKDAEADEEA
jgi:hypothetical protein